MIERLNNYNINEDTKILSQEREFTLSNTSKISLDTNAYFSPRNITSIKSPTSNTNFIFSNEKSGHVEKSNRSKLKSIFSEINLKSSDVKSNIKPFSLHQVRYKSIIDSTSSNRNKEIYDDNINCNINISTSQMKSNQNIKINS